VRYDHKQYTRHQAPAVFIKEFIEVCEVFHLLAVRKVSKVRKTGRCCLVFQKYMFNSNSKVKSSYNVLLSDFPAIDFPDFNFATQKKTSTFAER
ncbi:hypothetical protein QN344_04965, partial [Mucilaginibacter sp. 5B2]|nr:hypothetical protein [Mucilaginibacter sp. 5B2]